MKNTLEAQQVLVSDARLEYIPHTFVTLKPQDLQLATHLRDGLYELEEVVKVYDNIKGEDAES